MSDKISPEVKIAQQGESTQDKTVETAPENLTPSQAELLEQALKQGYGEKPESDQSAQQVLEHDAAKQVAKKNIKVVDTQFWKNEGKIVKNMGKALKNVLTLPLKIIGFPFWLIQKMALGLHNVNKLIFGRGGAKK